MRVLQRREDESDFVENIFERELGIVGQTSSLPTRIVEQTSSLSAARLSPIDRALCQELVYGICRWQETLDWLIARKTEGREQKPDLEILLRLGLYQMFWLDRIPNHAAVHETVEIAKKMGFTSQAGFLNAVLRTYTRERTETEKLLEQIKISDPAIGYSHPHWLYERWRSRWGAEKNAALMEWNNTSPKIFARLNTLKTNWGSLKQLWEIEGVKFVPHKFDWTADNLVFELESHPPLAKMKSFQKGFFYVQDPSTLLAVRELNPQPRETILDLCSAPGGKTTFIAQRMENRGKIFAQDSDSERLELVRENCQRLGVTCAEVSLAPNQIIEKPSLRFDRILIDAPCSNTGVMRRRVELRWRVQPGEIERLRETQLELLRRAAPRLKPGGTLIYSTCSLEPEENQEVVQQFLDEQKNFRLETERELNPFSDAVDGAFVAKIVADH